MVTRTVVPTDARSAFIERLLERGEFQSAGEAPRAGLRPLKRNVAEVQALRDRLHAGRERGRTGRLAAGTGEEAMRRAIAKARPLHAVSIGTSLPKWMTASS